MILHWGRLILLGQLLGGIVVFFASAWLIYQLADWADEQSMVMQRWLVRGLFATSAVILLGLVLLV